MLNEGTDSTCLAGWLFQTKSPGLIEGREEALSHTLVSRAVALKQAGQGPKPRPCMLLGHVPPHLAASMAYSVGLLFSDPSSLITGYKEEMQTLPE